MAKPNGVESFGYGLEAATPPHHRTFSIFK
jgi:hypothetical protein